MTLAMRLKDRLVASRFARTGLIEDGFEPELSYKPVFFNEWEWSFLIAVIRTVVPEGEDGSRDATRVPMFIDQRMVSSASFESSWYMLAPFLSDTPPVVDHQLRFPLRDLYRYGIAISSKVFLDETGRHFADASESERCSFLARLAAGRVNSRGVRCQAFFKQLLTDIKAGCVQAS